MATLDRISNPIFGILLKPALIQITRAINMTDQDATALDLLGVLHHLLRKGDAYSEKRIPKKRGGWRLLEKPYDKLKTVQRCILHGLLKRHYQPTPICHSFISGRFRTIEQGIEVWLPGRSIVSNALAHLGVVSEDGRRKGAWRRPRSLFGIDLKDAYPSVSDERIFEIYQEVMGDAWTSQIMTWLSTYQGCLPQGAPTSPALFNMACRGLDFALWEEFSREPYCVTRYADDIVLTSSEEEIPVAVREKLIRLCNQQGFVVNRAKDCYWRDYQRALRITGINLFPRERRLGLPKPVMEKFRAVLFHSVRILEQMKESDSGSFADSSERNRLVGRIRGIAGFTGMVYGHQPDRLWNWTIGGWPGVKELLASVPAPAAPWWPSESRTSRPFGPEQLWLSEEIFDKYFRDALRDLGIYG